MTDTFTPIMQPSTSSTRGAKARSNIAQFGDGYTQRSSDGLNGVPHTFQAVWPMLQSSDADTMEDFFEAHIATSFLWAPVDTTTRKWIATDWTRGYISAGVVSVTVNLTEVFDL